jgi:hypothetical protein
MRLGVGSFVPIGNVHFKFPDKFPDQEFYGLGLDKFPDREYMVVKG